MSFASPAFRVVLTLALGLSALQAQAQLFSDSEARRAILELRERVEANRQAADAAERRLGQEMTRLTEESAAPTRRSLLELASQIELLRGELATLRGQNESLARDVAELQRQQKDVLVVLDERIRALEPLKVTQDGTEFTATPQEKRDFDAAMAVLRQTEFPRAAQLFQQFLNRHTGSGYEPAVLYWLGNTHYALREYKEAIEVYQRLLTKAPQHPRVPEAKLAIANCHLELKDLPSARKVLEALVQAHPQTEAGATARDRLARLR